MNNSISVYHNTVNGQAPYLAYPTVNTTPPTAFNPAVSTTYTTADSFEKQQPEPANQAEQDKDKQKDSWVLPLLLVGGLLTLGIGVIALQDPETRTKVMNLLPFLKKEGEEGLGSSTHTPPSKPPSGGGGGNNNIPPEPPPVPLTNTGSNITPQNPPPPPPPIVKLPPVVITHEPTELQNMVETLDIQPYTEGTLTKVSITEALPTKVTNQITRTFTKQTNIPTILENLITDHKGLKVIWDLLIGHVEGNPYAHHINVFDKTNLSTQDLVILQGWILNSFKNPDEVFKGVPKELWGVGERNFNNAYITLDFFSDYIINNLKSYNKSFQKNGLNPEEHQLALAYALHNRALIKIVTNQIDLAESAFKQCAETLAPLDYTTKGSYGEFLYSLTSNYLDPYLNTKNMTNPVPTEAILPTKKQILEGDYLLLPPTFNSELAHGHIRKAEVLLASRTLNENTLYNEVREALKPALAYYYSYIQEQPNDWFGHLKMAETLYIQAQAELLIKKTDNAEVLLQWAKHWLDKAKTVEKNEIDRLKAIKNGNHYESGVSIPKDANDNRVDDILRWNIEGLQNKHNLSKTALPPSP